MTTTIPYHTVGVIVRPSTAAWLSTDTSVRAFRGAADPPSWASMGTSRQAVGAYGERCAVRYLVETGVRVAARNWRGERGEIDIIAWDGDVLAICEVKTRRTATFGPPVAAVVPAKARRLRRLAAQWLASNDASPREVRFDVIEVYASKRGAARVHHLKGAF